MVEVTIATEAFNLDEGQSPDALRRTLRYLTEKTDPASTEVLMAVTNPEHPDLGPITDAFPAIQIVDCRGMSYDRAKMEMARVAQGEIIAFLDGDCVPLRNDWLARLIAPIRAGRTLIACGVTSYEGGFFAKVCSILDFGFLYLDGDGDPVGCYASNNWAARRSHLLAFPVNPGGLRCNCYMHAQTMLAHGTPFRLVTEARVEHELPSFFKERWRRGTDFVGETRENPALRPARSSASVARSAWRLFVENLDWDRRRLAKARRLFGFSALQRWTALVLFPALRLVDLVAVVTALRKETVAPARAGMRRCSR